MILQNDSRFGFEAIPRWGCYYFDILFFVVKYTGLALNINKIESIYHALVYEKWMSEECWIFDPAAIFGFLGLKVDYRKERPGYICQTNEFEIVKYVWQRPGKKDWSHFVCGTGIGTGIAFDSYGCSKAVEYGDPWNKRVFKRL